MILKIFATVLALVPGIAFGVERTDAARISVQRVSMAGVRGPNIAKDLHVSSGVKDSAGGNVGGDNTGGGNGGGDDNSGDNDAGGNTGGDNTGGGDGDNGDNGDNNAGGEGVSGLCNRDEYRACMDEFCMTDESQGGRCSCSDNIYAADSIVAEIQEIQAKADKMYTEQVEREKLGATADYIFESTESAEGQKTSFSTNSLLADIFSTDSVFSEEDVDMGAGDLGSDSILGAVLYNNAHEYCASMYLGACADVVKNAETMLYSRSITADCKAYDAYLADQKRNAEANVKTAEAAVRAARLSVFGSTNKYNRGECLLAYRSCIADKGGCGTHFENCLSDSLLSRRANACEDILNQCVAVRSDVEKDWKEEKELVLNDAAKFASRNARQMCLANMQACLEDNCSIATNTDCLGDVNVALKICPISEICVVQLPGASDSVKISGFWGGASDSEFENTLRVPIQNKLKYLRTKFCQNDVTQCLQEKCGADFSAPECVGKRSSALVAMCPQASILSCNGVSGADFELLVSAATLKMDYQIMQGCVNHFADQLGRVCGTDMACLPSDDVVMGMTEVPENMVQARRDLISRTQKSVDSFFKDFEGDKTIAACASLDGALGDKIFNTARMIAQVGAENRALRLLEDKIVELSRKQDLAKAEENCYKTFAVETPDETEKNYSYIRSVVFEPDLRNCHVCRMQRVCEEGGESKATSALKAAAGGLAGGASMGTMVSPGWGTAIGGVIGAVGAGAVTAATFEGKKDFCTEIESCEDVNM